MRVLLDTHAYLWFVAGDERLSPRGRKIISAPDADLWISVASLWETAIKHALGKLPLARPYADLISEQLALDGVRVLPISTEHLAQLVELPHVHRDPFDRLIVAQALVEDLPLLTRDRQLSAYGADVVWDETT